MSLCSNYRADSGADLQATVEAAGQVQLEGLVQLAWFNHVQPEFQQPVDLVLLWRWFQVPNQGMQKRDPDPVQLGNDVGISNRLSMVIRLSVFESIQNLAWHCMFQRLLLNKLYHVCLVLDAFMLGRPIRRFYLLMFIT